MKVRRDGTVFFCGNYYQLKEEYTDRWVLCQNTGKEVMLYHGGEEIGRFPYLPKTKGMVMLSEEVLKITSANISQTVLDWGVEVAARRQPEIYQEKISGATR